MWDKTLAHVPQLINIQLIIADSIGLWTTSGSRLAHH
jgi:hypothetical protein